MRPLRIILKALFQLSLAEMVGYGIYLINLRMGRYHRLTPAREITDTTTIEKLDMIASQPPKAILASPSQDQMEKVLGKYAKKLLAQADEIVRKQVQLYGGNPTLLDLKTPASNKHWSIAQNLIEGDIKDFWELARFGWAFILGRAYTLNGDERYSQAFWENFETFLEENPRNQGVNWASGQEVALRILAFVFAWQVFASSPQTTIERKQKMVRSIYEHALRIPPTLIYAKAQKNNHLISESVGLFTAGYLLSDLPEAKDWSKTGWDIFTTAIQEQIDDDGTYIMQSINYHRAILHLALWANEVAGKHNKILPEAVRGKLASATRWLLAQVDPISGAAPNLGSNDGSLLLPLTTCPINNYRPIAQSASMVFLGIPSQDQGEWDEMSLWLGQPLAFIKGPRVYIESPGVNKLGTADSWGTLRAARFFERPSHADQLHVDLWWQGHNIAIDAGTFRYNAPPPWENGLAHTKNHNTVLIDNKDQMLRASRFLWLDWAQAKKVTEEKIGYHKIVAEHNGYRKDKIIHRRSLYSLTPYQWMVEDLILPKEADKTPRHIQLHWLTQDWPFQVFDDLIRLKTPFGTIEIVLNAFNRKNKPIKPPEAISIIRAGRTVHGHHVADETYGWISPTYSVKKPALSILYEFESLIPVKILCNWNFIYAQTR